MTIPAGSSEALVQLNAAVDARHGTTELSIGASAPVVDALPVDTSAKVKLLVRGKPGALDTTFGELGKKSGIFGPGAKMTAHGFVVQPDDRVAIIAHRASPFAGQIARLMPDGQLDTSYGPNGNGIGGMNPTTPRRIALQADGKILIAGQLATDHILSRRNADGSADTTFGTKGGWEYIRPTPRAPESSTATFGIAPRADGGAFVSFSWDTGSTLAMGLVNFAANGTILTTWGGSGYSQTGFTNVNYGSGVGVRPDGRAFMVGSGAAPYGYGILQVDATGNYDATFGATGTGRHFVQAAMGSGLVTGTILEADGSVIFPMTIANGFVLAKYTSAGKLDGTFGVGGVATFPEGIPGGLVRQSDGKIVVGFPASYAMKIRRFMPNGSLDGTFGEAGTATVSFSPVSTSGAWVGLQADGRVVVVTTAVGSSEDVVVFRLWS